MEVLQDDLCLILDLEGLGLGSFLQLERRTRTPSILPFRTVQKLERQRQRNGEFCEKEDTWIDLSTPQG